MKLGRGNDQLLRQSHRLDWWIACAKGRLIRFLHERLGAPVQTAAGEQQVELLHDPCSGQRGGCVGEVTV